jgi:hypothetical protein
VSHQPLAVAHQPLEVLEVSCAGSRVVTRNQQLDAVHMRIDELAKELLDTLIMVSEARGDHPYPNVNA